MRVELLGAPYSGKNVIASGQEAVNVYAEFNNADPQAPSKVTYYLTPGFSIYATPISNENKVRATYRTSIGTAYVVIGSSLYFLTDLQTLIFIGFVADRPSQVIMADNGLVVTLVDGVNGYVVDMVTNDFGQILDPNFYGASWVQYLDTFFIFNRPETNQFYITASMANFGMLTNSGIESGSITNAGLGYVNGTYEDVPFTGGTGEDATAIITIGGTGVRTGTITNAGTLYTAGTYLNVALTGGAGTGARADITIAAGSITQVVITDPGDNYVIGNTLSANAADIGGTGSNFQYTVDTLGGEITAVDIANAGQGYLLSEVLSIDNTDVGGSGSGFQYTITAVQSAFDPLDIAAKSGSADPIVAIVAVHKELWLIGELTSEVWIGTGAADFYFQLQQGAFIDHGCAAQYSVAYQDILSFWLMQDKQGRCIVVKAGGYQVEEISTPRLVEEFASYSTVEDAIGFCFQISDHSFYCLTFPTANKTWLYDLKTGWWFEWSYTADGTFNRHRANCGMFVYNKNLIGDWENGQLLELDVNLYQDDENPIVRVRTFMHMMDDGKRVTYEQFIADMECGTSVQETEDDPDPVVNLSFSDDRGVSYSNKLEQSLGREGQTLVQPSWNRLGMARDRVFKLEWSANTKTALNGAFVEVTPHYS